MEHSALRVAAITLLLAGLSLPGCNRQDSTAVDQWDRSLADRATLIETLPDNTLAYVRIPEPWGLIGAPKSSALAPALGSPANREALALLQARLPELLNEEFGESPAWAELLTGLRSPLEIAMVGDGQRPMEATMFIEARLAIDSLEAVNTLLREIATPASMVQLLTEASEEHPGQILAGIMPLFYHFDADSGRLRMLSGLQADQQALINSFDWPANPGLELLDWEQRLDAARHGLFVWLNTATMSPALANWLQPEQLSVIEDIGALSTRRLAIGYGTAGGRSRLAVLARGSDGLLWKLGPSAWPDSRFATTGEPRAVIGLGIPDHDWFERLRQEFELDLNQNLDDIEQKLKSLTSLELSDLFDALSGRMYYISDDNGSYLALEGHDAGAWQQVLQALETHVSVQRRSIRHGRATIEHVIIPGIDIDEDDSSQPFDEQMLSLAVRRFMGLGTHFFWMHDEDTLLLALVPQVLMDRIDHPGDQPLQAWLDDAGGDAGNALLTANMRIHDAPRRNYYSYLGTLLAIGDLLDTSVNIANFPSSRALNLPAEGRIGLQVDYTRGELGAVLSFENHPGDLISGGATGPGVAIVAILAAVAIPSYQQYTQRAQVASAFADTASARLILAEFYANHGRLPDADEIGDLALDWQSDLIESLYFDPEAGVLVAELWMSSDQHTLPQLILTPITRADGLLDWQCSARDIDERHLPAICRSD